MIFKEVARQATRSADRYISFFRLMLVCRRYHDIILGNVTFWSHITASDEESIRFALKSIDRSRGGKLGVGLRWHSSSTAEQMTVLLSTLADQSHRLGTFSVVSPSLPTLPRWTSPATNLHTLAIRNKGAKQPLTNFFGGPLPRLRYLALEGFCSWPGGLFCDLHYITLQVHSTPGATSFMDLLDLLAASPKLRSLNIGGYITAPRLRHHSRVIALPHLTSLTIYKSSFRDILGHVSLPSTVEVRLMECTDTVGDPQSNALPGRGNPILSCLTGFFTLSVILDFKRSTLNLAAFKHGKPTPTLVIKNRITPQFGAVVAQSLEYYATIHPFASVEVLFVVTDAPSQIPWNQCFSGFPSLRQLTVRTRDISALYATLHKELGSDPILYSPPEHTPTQNPHGMKSLHVDWRATSRRVYYCSAFGGSLRVEPRRTTGLVSQMKPRG